MTLSNLSINKASGESVEMKSLIGKVILIVNTATKCGLASQFEGLEKLHQKYEEKGLVVIGMPCNQFLGQEPESNESVVETCLLNHGVTFLLTEKIDVNGKNTHPVFKFLKKNLNGFLGGSIKWNFTKFLVDQNGQPIKRFSPTTKPEDVEKDIINLLKK
jgi:glutathione peroxidase